MIQLELYIREITRFLRTVTIKNVYFKDQMEDSYVADAFIGKLPDELHPYYRHLLGKCSYESFDEFRSVAGIAPYDETDPTTISDAQLAVDYGFDYVAIPATSDIVEYQTINGIYVKLRYYQCTINGKEYIVYPNCVLYYGQICPVRILYKKFDELITINSIDSNEVIPFNSTMIGSKKHQKTASVYRMPSTYYSKLCSTYPLMTDVIKAIVYPVPSLEACVNAENYSLISCDLEQLKENERTSMYVCLLDTLSMIKRRWDVPDFTYEDLYALSIQAKIWDVLLLALMKQRIVNIRTSAAHEYHIWEYLKSKGLEDYRDVLSLKQALFLYKNFPYLLRNRGSDFNLILLAHKLLSDWNIEISGKNILQTKGENDTFSETCKTSPVVDSIVVGETVLDKLKSIDTNDADYLNKTMKSYDELHAFDYRKSLFQELNSGTIETLTSLYGKEQSAGLEYQNEFMFDKSTTAQTKLFTNTPHTAFVTKLLEITKITVSTLFKQIYARFMTESLLYRAAMGDTDYIISFIPDGMSYSIDIPVNDAIGLVWYCALKETGWYNNDDAKSYPYIYLTVPYKKEFEPIQETFKWNNKEFQTMDILRVIPVSFVLDSDDLPRSVVGEYHIVDRSAYSKDWVWVNDSGSITIGFEEKDGERVWKLKTPSNTLIADFRFPYTEWTHQEITWKQGNSEYKSVLKLVEYEYMLDYLMPLRETSNYQSLIELLHEQALGYIQIYKELYGSDWSRQHTGVVDVIKSRTVNEVVKLEMFGGLTFKEFIDQNTNIKEIIDKIEGNTVAVARTEYAKLGNRILKSLFNIDTDYLEDNAGVSMNRFQRLKELFINLCSYNVTFLDGSVGSTETSMTIADFITQDYDWNKTVMSSMYYLDPSILRFAYPVCGDVCVKGGTCGTAGGYMDKCVGCTKDRNSKLIGCGFGFPEPFCITDIKSSILVEPPTTPFYISDTCCDTSFDTTIISTKSPLGHLITTCEHDVITFDPGDPSVVVPTTRKVRTKKKS